MTAIDFNRIRGDRPGGQRAAFEELVCQLASREAPNDNSFRRIEGAGGDGGVECTHTSASGGTVGYQARYFTESRSIAWAKVRRAAESAMANYPDLTRYVVAIACDFTGRRRGRHGVLEKGAWGQWDKCIRSLERAAARLGRQIAFVPWTAAELRSRLTPTNAGGLRLFWFGQLEFSDDWFKRRIELATVALGDRYHPEDHVEVASQELFDFIGRHRRSLDKLKASFAAIAKACEPSRRLSDVIPTAPESVLKNHAAALDTLVRCIEDLQVPVSHSWDVESWKLRAQTAGESVRELIRLASDATEHTEEPQRSRLNSVRSSLWSLQGAIEDLTPLLGSAYVTAESKRMALVSGRAGTGKSHLLARIGEMAVLERRPVVLFLGQQLRDQALWPQILQRLGIEGVTAEDFLGALDAASEAATVRGLVLVDAINEGPGLRLWRSELAPFLTLINKYRNLACVLTCRSEYVPYLVPSDLLGVIPRVVIRGFETEEERATAARVYLDKRGISRPATPWLAPEFTNPLFLRSCCNALQKSGRSEFPRGLAGTKEVLSFFIGSAARFLIAEREGSDDLVRPTKQVLAHLARSMAAQRHDYLPRDRAQVIAALHFRGFSPPANANWLEVLHRNGLLRFDPDPNASPQDALTDPVEVVRFSFQRFQDHLIAEALLVTVKNVKKALARKGSLAFIHANGRIRPQWHGLVEALSVQIPERFRQELADVLPGGYRRWWPEWSVWNGFAESVRWRKANAFSVRALELFNILLSMQPSSFSLLLELSASIDHPWNAEFIHRNLIRRTMPQRDRLWTANLNLATDDPTHPVHRLIDWSLYAQDSRTEFKTQYLCSLVLTWCFTASNRRVRDLATKALTKILLSRAELFPALMKAFRRADDPYVVERLLGAAFGSCCIQPDSGRLRSYSLIVAKSILLRPRVARDVLLRDYASGIVQRAAHEGVLPKSIAVDRCLPPFTSSAPRLDVSEAQLTAVAAKAGDKTILFSCSAHGDFGRNEIQPRVERFVNVSLQEAAPYSQQERFEVFEREVLRRNCKRRSAMRHLQAGLAFPIRFSTNATVSRVTRRSRKAAKALHARLVSAERGLLALLTPSEQLRYVSEAVPWLSRSSRNRGAEPKTIDLHAAQRWVAHRAYKIAGRKPLQEAPRQYEGSGSRAVVERIGKKYQWIALDELLAGLADNYWLGGLHGWGTKRYTYPPDIGFVRDIDPTVLPRRHRESEQMAVDPWAFGPQISIGASNEKGLHKWPFLERPGRDLADLTHRSDPDGRDWFTLYDHQHAEVRYEREEVQLHGLRQQEFRFVFCVLVQRSDLNSIVSHIIQKRGIDVHSWDPPHETDGGYLFEAPWRGTWNQRQWRDDGWQTPDGLPFSLPVYRYQWESHLDSSLPEGAYTFLPSPWLALRVGLQPDTSCMSSYTDANRRRVFFSQRTDNSTAVLIDATLLQSFLQDQSLSCLWLFVAERGAWPGGNNDKATYRRAEGLCWFDGSRHRTKTWVEDHKRFDSEPAAHTKTPRKALKRRPKH